MTQTRQSLIFCSLLSLFSVHIFAQNQCADALDGALSTILEACEEAEAGEVVNFKQCKNAIRTSGLPAVRTCILGTLENEEVETGRAGKIWALVEAFALEFVMPLVEAGMEMPMHGYYCGPNYGDANFTQNPKDELDNVCMIHDQCYDSDGQFSCDCDEAMIRDLLLGFREAKFEGRQYFKALGSLVYFTLAECNEQTEDSNKCD